MKRSDKTFSDGVTLGWVDGITLGWFLGIVLAIVAHLGAAATPITDDHVGTGAPNIPIPVSSLDFLANTPTNR